MSQDQILIVRYPNRRLYNTNASEYLNLAGVESLVKEGKNIKIIDKKTKEDLTKQYLLQIITKFENKEGDVLTVNLLNEIIKNYNSTAQKFMPDLLSSSFDFFKKQQNEFIKNLNNKYMNPLINETSSKTIEEWHSKQIDYMNNFFNLTPKKTNEDDFPDNQTSINIKDEIEILKKQISEIKDQLDKK